MPASHLLHIQLPSFKSVDKKNYTHTDKVECALKEKRVYTLS